MNLNIHCMFKFIIKIGNTIISEQFKIADRYNAMSEEERKNNFKMRERHEQLEFKWHSLRDVLWFKQGHLEMTLPEDIEYPADYVKEEKGIKKLVNTIFKRRNNKDSK